MKIVVVGGGTAGCISALMFKKFYPEHEVVMIDSSKIGILGPGEGTAPIFNSFLETLEIDIDEFMRETESTIKNGIKFSNWGVDTPFYFHGFYNIDRTGYTQKSLPALAWAAHVDSNLDSINLSYKMSKINKYPSNSKRDYAWHFDARKLADYLKVKAEALGVIMVDAVVDQLVADAVTGDITSLALDNGQSLDCDFIIDCSGFKRLIVGNHYKSEWVDVRDSLPCDTAVAFFMEKTKDKPPYTEANAMNYGWSWRIPLKHRWGCGYVYDSSFLSEEEAKKEITDKYGDVEFVTSFSFKAGYYKDTWINNVLAVGISNGFFEPLEATSINMSLVMLYRFIQGSFNTYNQHTSEASRAIQRYEFNSYIRQGNEYFTAFLYLHYMTRKTDTEFWSKFTEKQKIPATVQKFIDNLVTTGSTDIKAPASISSDLTKLAIISKRFTAVDSWVVILVGNGLLEDYDHLLTEDAKQAYLSLVEETDARAFSDGADIL